MKTNIIAEIGTNFNSIEQAFDCIKAAKEVGADYAKFQLYTNKDLYGVDGDRNTLITINDLDRLYRACSEIGIGFICTGFSPDTYKHINKFVDVHKIASCENEHREILETVASFGKPTLVSMGGMTDKKIMKTKEIFEGANTGRVKGSDGVQFAELIPMYCEIAYPHNVFSHWKVSLLRSMGFNKVGVSSHLNSTDYFYRAIGSVKAHNPIDQVMAHFPDYFEFHFDPFKVAMNQESLVSLDSEEAKRVIERVRTWNCMEYEIEEGEAIQCKRGETGFRGV